MNLHTTNTGISVAPRRSNFLTAANYQDIDDFARDLEDAVRDIAEAAKQSSEVKGKAELLQKSLADRDWWRQLTAGLSGDTDKELAVLVTALGASLSVTQKVVQVILKVMTQKNQVLQAFNDALVKKIALVTADTRTLDGNQKGAVKSFLVQLQKQVFDQIQQQHTVDDLELRMIDCEAWREEKNSHDQAVREQLTVQDGHRKLATARAQAIEGSTKALAEQADRLTQQQASEGARINGVEHQVQLLEGRLDAQQAQINHLLQMDSAQKVLMGALEQRVSALEATLAAQQAPMARLSRHLPAVAALLLGGMALYLSLAV